MRITVGRINNGNAGRAKQTLLVTYKCVVRALVQKFIFGSQGCNCNYIVFTKLPWPGDSEGTFRSSSQAATCPPVYHTRRRTHTVSLIAERQAGKL